MRALHLVSFALLVIACLACAETPKDPAIAVAARALNSQSKTTLGVSVRALSFLNDAGYGEFLAARGLDADNSWTFLEELERAGYAKTHRFPSEGGDLVQIELTEKGQELLDALHGP